MVRIEDANVFDIMDVRTVDIRRVDHEEPKADLDLVAFEEGPRGSLRDCLGGNILVDARGFQAELLHSARRGFVPIRFCTGLVPSVRVRA